MRKICGTALPRYDCALPLVAILLALGCTLARSASGGATTGKVKGDGPGVKLFHAGFDALAWDSDELTRIRQLHAKDFSDKQAFLDARNMADYLGLSPVEAMHMPVPLSIVFIGFAGDGNMNVNVTTAEIQTWFGHLDHVLPHTRIDMSDITCAEDGYCRGLVHGQFQSTPVHSYVHMNLTCQVVVVQRKEVIHAFDRAIHVFSRPVDPELETGSQQVDATKMEALIDNFVQFMGLDRSYTIVVLNPAWSPAEPAYGYRQGLSQGEITHLLGPGSKPVMDLLSQGYIAEPALPQPYATGSWRNNWYSSKSTKSIATKFSEHDAVWYSNHWANTIEAYLKAEEDYRASLMSSLGKEKGAAAVVHGVRVLRNLQGPLAQVLREDLMLDRDTAAANLHSRFRSMHPAEDCMVSNWVGHSRWLMLDLTAGGKDWGPALGGDGVVHKHTLPNVHEHFSNLHSMKRSARESMRQENPEEHALATNLAHEKQAHLAAVGNKQYHAYMMRRQARERDARAPDAQALDPHKEHDDWSRSYQEAMAKAELELYERFAMRHCHNMMNPPHICMDMKDEVDKLRTIITKLSSSRGVGTEVFPKHKWDIFGFEDQYADLKEMYPELSEEEVRAHELFMADLTAVLSRAIRHVIVPPTAAWRQADGYSHLTATPYAKQVNFEIYVISESAQVMEYARARHFPLEDFKEQVSSLALPHQKFDFTSHAYTLLDDPVLATAFSASIRTAHQEIPSSEELLEGEAERLFIDSRELAYHLRRTLAQHHDIRKTSPGFDHTHLNVPIFIFELHRDWGVLIDEHYNAKALDDMILVVQNAARDDEHPTGMMCGGSLLARPLSPLKDALAATLLYLGGVLPPHLGYNPGKHKVNHDWLWSVGAHPLSATSVGTRYTQVQKDALGRSYLLDAMDSAADKVNAGIRKLRATHTTHSLYAHVLKSQPKLVAMLRKFDHLVSTWRSIVTYAYELEWGPAADLISVMQQESVEFYDLAVAVSTGTESMHCSGKTTDDSARHIHSIITGSGAVAIGAALYALWPRLLSRSNKMRLN
mmetsp:Transcript_38308/g.85303  ORF Transcript_38308/g.85303 Transcript_38308/m.85303 type:complete len:1048 (+) Transcript_38308:131-3274(+)